MHYDHLRNEFFNPAFPAARDHKTVLQFAHKRKNMQENNNKWGLFKLANIAKFKLA